MKGLVINTVIVTILPMIFQGEKKTYPQEGAKNAKFKKSINVFLPYTKRQLA